MMYYAKDYPLNTVLVGKHEVGMWLVNVEIDGIRYWEEQEWGDLYTVVDADLFEIEVMI